MAVEMQGVFKMQYSVGSIGRVVVAKIEHGDDLRAEIEDVLRREKISAAVMYMIGAMQDASLVVGPQAATTPPEPVWRKINDAHELLGIGTAFRDENEMVIHLHTSAGRGENSLTGCLREDSKVYLVVELIIFEILGSNAIRGLDEKTGLKLLGFQFAGQQLSEE
jgi:predicted DNA-binding protein with PD1-like motif